MHERYQIMSRGQTPMFEGFGQGKAMPFYATEDPVGAFIKALQTSLGVSPTGRWDITTHVAFWQAFVEFARLHPAEGRETYMAAAIASMPLLPWQPRICRTDAIASNPMFAGEFMRDAECVDTAFVVFNLIDDAAREMFPGMAELLRIESWDALRDDPEWEGVKGQFTTSLVAHVATQLALPPCPTGQALRADGTCGTSTATCPAGQVLLPDGTCGTPTGLATTEPWYKKTSTWLLIGGGVLVVGLLIWSATRKTEPQALPAAAKG